MESSDCFYKLPFKLNLDNIIADISNKKIVFENKSFNTLTSRVPSVYRSEFCKIFNLPDQEFFYQGKFLQGVFQLMLIPPSTGNEFENSYITKWHKDRLRQSIIIIPLSEDNENHFTEFKLDNNSTIKIPYSKGYPVIFNPKIDHRVTNIGSSNRITLSIAFKELTYYNLIKMFEEDKLINMNQLSSSTFYSA
jgi:hypothetical protein